jgi:hypothetical protein
MIEPAAATINQAFLQAALAWLRALLRTTTGAERTHVPQPPWDRLSVVAADLPSEASAVDEIGAARRALDAATRGDPAPAFVTLAERLGLSSFEQNILLLAAAMELDSGFTALVAAAHGDPQKRAPTFALGLELFGDGSWEALAPARPLRFRNLVEVHQSGSGALLTAPLRVDERIAAYIKGLNYLDERIAGLSVRLPIPSSLPPSQLKLAGTLAGWLQAGRSGAIQLIGADSSAKRDVVAVAAAMAGCELVALASDALPAHPDALEAFLKLWDRESRLLRLTLYVEGVEARTEAGRDGSQRIPLAVFRAIGQLVGPVLVDTRQPCAELAGAPVIEIDRPTEAEQCALWRSALAGGDALDSGDVDSVAMELAGEFSFAASRVAAIAADARLRPTGAKSPGLAQLRSFCIAHSRGALDALAERIEPRATLDDLMMPASEKALLTRLVAQAKNRTGVLTTYGFRERTNRGLGTVALFHGESGTGKTMAAEAIANALGLLLYRIDVSAVVNKYIGETEKQLRLCFDDADAGGKMVFFDECEAFFGRRSEVKDSHDRYANIEISYLLQRLESFRGVAVLATNMRHALDTAFVRRLRFIIGFPFPGVAERIAIWRSVFPAGAPVGDLDWDYLARFSISGGSIFNAALASAHAAAADKAAVTEMRHVLDAIRLELRKLDRPLGEAEFSWTRRPAGRAELGVAA